MAQKLETRLGLMMFLDYLGDFLHFSGIDIGWIFATLAIASLTAVVVSGQIADRYFASEKFLAFSHLVGGLAMFALAFQKSFWPFFVGMLIHNVMYMPTLSLTNAIAFHHEANHGRRL